MYVNVVFGSASPAAGAGQFWPASPNASLRAWSGRRSEEFLSSSMYLDY
jgi:hypothetical protein